VRNGFNTGAFQNLTHCQAVAAAIRARAAGNRRKTPVNKLRDIGTRRAELVQMRSRKPPVIFPRGDVHW
jgi:hypothetical protein